MSNVKWVPPVIFKFAIIKITQVTYSTFYWTLQISSLFAILWQLWHGRLLCQEFCCIHSWFCIERQVLKSWTAWSFNQTNTVHIFHSFHNIVTQYEWILAFKHLIIYHMLSEIRNPRLRLGFFISLKFVKSLNQPSLYIIKIGNLMMICSRRTLAWPWKSSPAHIWGQLQPPHQPHRLWPENLCGCLWSVSGGDDDDDHDYNVDTGWSWRWLHADSERI